MLDTEDAEMLTVLRLLGPARERAVAGIVPGGADFGRVHERLMNLQDRLIVVYDSGSGSYRINPVVADQVHDFATRLDLLFPSKPLSRRKIQAAWTTRDLLFDLVSLAAISGRVVKGKGGFLKKFESELSTRFPLAFSDPEGPRRAAALIDGAALLGGARLDEGRVVPNREGLLGLADLEEEIADTLVAAAVVSSIEGTDDLDAALAAVVAVCGSVPDDRVFSRDAALRLMEATSGSGPLDENYLDALVDADLLYRVDDTAVARPGRPDRPVETPGVVVQANFEVLVPGRLPGRRGLELSLLAEPRRIDVSRSYEITDRSVMSALSLGMTNPIERLRELAGAEVPQNVAFSVDQWTRRHRGIQVHLGPVLIVNEEFRHLVDHNAGLAPLIDSVPAPGVYLLKSTEGLGAFLRKAGLPEHGAGFSPSGQAPGRPAAEQTEPPGHDTRRLGRLAAVAGRRPRGVSLVEKTIEPATPLPDTGEDPRPALRRHLEDLDLEPAAREEALLRIDRKLVLREEQLATVVTRGEIDEARGVDLVGKIRMFEQAVHRQHEILEIILRDEFGNPLRFLFRPSVVKRQGDRIVADGYVVPELEQRTVVISKVYLVRRMVGTLIGAAR